MSIGQDAERVLQETSRTFAIPVAALPDPLRAPVMSFFLCLRGIDEIEDHTGLSAEAKRCLLGEISRALQAGRCTSSYLPLLRSHTELPEVARRIDEWAAMAPTSIAYRTWETLASMADHMAEWVGLRWRITNESDLDRYTFDVAGTVGLLLSDLWAWFDGSRTDRSLAVGFGRGLQTVNILQNRRQDLARGVDYFPPGWTEAQVRDYAVKNLAAGDRYVAGLAPGPVLDFCRVPLTLGWATLDILRSGRTKLTRGQLAALLGGLPPSVHRRQ
ncbi:squalene/phytoene synthase family protein [Streptomyces pathocidini]|uniref:squalene/phytoene synthase family protein n=1 Tax=Streptomyces pathocidini TaxID=1650571 RepID=UPI00340F26C1